MKIERTFIEFDLSGNKSPQKGAIAVEYPLTIVLNGKNWASLYCSPQHLDELAVGFLQSEGTVEKLEEILEISLSPNCVALRINKEVTPKEFIITSSGGRFPQEGERDLKPLDLEKTFEGKAILELVKEFEKASSVWQLTHGVHSAALSDGSRLLVFREDLGRHNAVDKVYGHFLLQGLSAEGTILLLSGRISSEMVSKALRRKSPLIVSLASPTDKALSLAEKAGITVIGQAREGKMKIYTFPQRIL
jgi:FdhD protein